MVFPSMKAPHFRRGPQEPPKNVARQIGRSRNCSGDSRFALDGLAPILLETAGSNEGEEAFPTDASVSLDNSDGGGGL